MAEIAKCACGADGVCGDSDDGKFSVICSRTFECWCGPDCPTESEAIAAWNRVMRPRPVLVEEKLSPATGCHFSYGVRVIGSVLNRDWKWCALFGQGQHQGCSMHPIAFADCRSWLIAKLTAAGFDVAEREEA